MEIEEITEVENREIRKMGHIGSPTRRPRIEGVTIPIRIRNKSKIYRIGNEKYVFKLLPEETEYLRLIHTTV